MAKYKETCDLYDDEGKLLKSNVTLDKVSPLVNPAIKKLINLTKRTVAINLAGIDEWCEDRKDRQGHQILGRSLKTDVIKGRRHARLPRSRRWSRSPTATTPRSRRSAAASSCSSRCPWHGSRQRQPTMRHPPRLRQQPPRPSSTITRSTCSTGLS